MSSEGIRRDVEEICSFEGRGAGTDAERRLSNRLAERLRERGMEVAVEPINCHPRAAAVHLGHCAMALFGGLLGVYVPVAGFAVVLLAAVSAYFDLNGRFYLLRLLWFRRASQNVYATPAGPPRADAERLILCANVDAPRGTARPSLAERALQPLARRIPSISGARAWFWAIALLLVPIGIRAAGTDEVWVSALQLPPMLILVVACFALGDRALASLRGGADDNASGVAAVLEAQRRLFEDPPRRLRVEFVLLGAGAPGMEGMRELIRAHRGELSKPKTRFVALERVGAGEPHFLLAQGPVVSMPVDARLVAACRAIASSGDPDTWETGKPRERRDGGSSAAHVARAHRYPSVAITGDPSSRPADTVEALDLGAIAAAADFAVAVARLVDRELERSAPTGEGAPSLAASSGPAAT